MLEETSQAAVDTLAFQLLGHRRNLFQELIRRATQRTLLRPDRHDLPFGLWREERTILWQVFAIAERCHRRNERDADPGTDEGLNRSWAGAISCPMPSNSSGVRDLLQEGAIRSGGLSCARRDEWEPNNQLLSVKWLRRWMKQRAHQATQAVRERIRNVLSVGLADLRFVENGWIVRAGVKLARNANRQKYLAHFRPTQLEERAPVHASTSERVTAIFAEVLKVTAIGPDR